MTRVNAKVILVSATSVTVSAALLSFMLIGQPQLKEDTQAVPDSQATQLDQPPTSTDLPVGTEPPVGQLPVGALAAIRAVESLPARVTSNSTIPNFCNLSLNGAWNTYAVTDSGKRVAVVVTPAGQGGATYSAARSSLNVCSQVQVRASTDTQTTVSIPGSTSTWTLSRSGDILVSVFAPGGVIPPAPLPTTDEKDEGDFDPMDPLDEEVPEPEPELVFAVSTDTAEELIAQMQPYCLGDSLSTQNNPLFPNYTPYAPTQQFQVPTPAALQPEHVYPTTMKPLVVLGQPRPDLAIIYPPNEAVNSLNTPLVNAPRYPAPFVAGELDVPLPSSPRPYSQLPQKVPAKPISVSIDVPAQQDRGPGCGWEFSGTNPLVAQAAPDFSLDLAYLAELEDFVSESSNWLTAATQYQNNAAASRALSRSIAEWDAYDTAVALAAQKYAEAQAAYAQSLQIWQSYIPPAVVPVPVPPLPAVEVPGEAETLPAPVPAVEEVG